MKSKFPEVEQQKQYDHVSNWHDKGITGKGINVWDAENLTEHGEMTAIRVHDSAPDANVINAGVEMASDRNKGILYAYVEYKGKKYEVEDFIKEFDIHIITKSIGGGNAEGGPESKFWNDLKRKYNLTIFNSAGNDGHKDIGGAIPPDVAIYVGACTLDKYGKPVRANYSSVGEQLDFIDFVGFYSGTSFAAPYLAGKAALLKQRYGKQITQDQIESYFIAHADDMLEPGKDDESGYGIVIMGDTNETGELYFGEMYDTKLRFKINSDIMVVSKKGQPDRTVILDQPAVVNPSTGRTLVPLRAITEALGCDVEYTHATREIVITMK